MSWFDKLFSNPSAEELAERLSQSRETVKDYKSPYSTLEVSAVEEVEKPSYYDSVIIPKFQEAERGVIAGRENLFRELSNEYQRLCDTFQFSCVRHGDFLTLYVTSLLIHSRARDQQKPPKVAKVVEVVNLGNVSKIILLRGHAPDMEGITAYRIGVERKEEKDRPITSASTYAAIYSDKFSYKQDPGEGYYHEVFSIPPDRDNVTWDGKPKVITSLEMAEKDRPQSIGDYLRSRPSGQLPEYTQNTPRPAQDSLIGFVGVDIALCVPFAKTDDVFNAIMKAIASGYEPKSSILNTPSI
jgi:hypothetical protein